MTQDFAYIHQPTRLERFWRWAGFRFHLGEEPAWAKDGPPQLGWMKTVSVLKLSFADRMRLLISGHLIIENTVETDTPSPSRISTRMDWQIVAPGENEKISR